MRRPVVLLAAALVLTASCGREAVAPAPEAPRASKVPLYDNLGTYSHKVTTSQPLAQRYFDQGLRWVYGFNHDEAKRAFEEAARLDPECAMAHWGVALTLGPNYNLPTDAEREKQAVEAVEKARKLAPHASEAERAYIEALTTRYSADPKSDRAAKDRAYAEAMRELSKRYPDDLDAATLFAEALMDLRPWKLWNPDGTPAPETEEIVATLEGVLARNPDHPGANHYYIHATEASPDPGKALAAAGKIAALVPGAGHLVHMPAHVYHRTGRYAESAAANRDAVAADRKYLTGSHDQMLYRLMYYTHNVHFLSSDLAMEGRSKECLEAARNVEKEAPHEMVKEMQMAEYFSPVALWALVRFGKWDEILAEPKPPDFMPYTQGMWHYARGMALLSKGKVPDAQGELEDFEAAAAKVSPEQVVNLNLAVDLLKVARGVLAGETAAKQGNAQEAVRLLEDAVKAEDGLQYDEPPPWFSPVRHNLGAVLLKAGRPEDAERVYREDLAKNPENGWSLLGLSQALRAQGKKEEAAKADERFKTAWARADVEIPASRL